MSEVHLSDLRNKLESSHWKVVSELEGNDYDVSGIWLISRLDGKNEIHLEFHGLDDMETLPIEQSYGCRIQENPNVSLYFSRVGRSWQQELAQFIGELNNVAT